MSKYSEEDVLMDHEYDGIQELDNRLPPWWLWLFYITIIWSALYMLHYHVLGTGDSSYAEYMKEFDPDWQPPASESGFSFAYQSPIAAGEDMTPLKRLEAELKAAQEAELAAAEGAQLSVPISDMSFDELIIAAMQVSQPEDLEKLKSTFPDIFVQYEARLSGSDEAELLAEAAPAEPEPEIAMLTDEASLAAGKKIYIANCATCHGQNGEGGIGPNMTDNYFIHGAGMNNTVRILNNGVPAKGMIAWRGILKEEQILQVSSYVLSLRGTDVPNGKAPQGELITSNE